MTTYPDFEQPLPRANHVGIFQEALSESVTGLDPTSDDLLPSPFTEQSLEINESIIDTEANPVDNQRFLDRLGDTLGSLWKETWEKGHRTQRLGALALGATTQALDRGRFLIFAAPWAFDHTLTSSAEHHLNSGETAAAAGIALGGLFGAWGWIVGKSFHTSLNAYPQTTEKVTENHPAMVDVISKAIDGFPSKEELITNHPQKPEDGYDIEPYETRKSLLGKAALALTRGVKTAFLFGTTAHVGVAKVSEHSERSNEKRRRVVTAEGAAVLGAIGAGLSGMVSADFLGIAQDVRDTITDKNVLTGSTVALIALAAVSNYISRRKFLKQESTQEQLVQEAV